MSALDLRIHLSRPDRELSVETGLPSGITAVCGVSGSGKTSLFRCIAGLEPDVAGSILAEGEVWLGERRPLAPHRRGIGYCFQDSRVLPHLTVRGNLRFGAWTRRLRRCNWQPAIGMDEIAERLRLGPLLNRPGKRLSGGEARRVALGRALLSARTLLLLDEPFVGLDQGMCTAVRSLAADFHARSGIPVLLATHQIRKVLGLTERVLLMDEGRCLACGSLTDLLRKPVCAEARVRVGFPNVLNTFVRWQDPIRRATLCQLSDRQGTAAGFRLPVFRTPYSDEPEGAPLRFALDPNGISLSAEPLPAPASANQLTGRIEAVSKQDGEVHVLVSAGTLLMVYLNPRATASLPVEPGSPVWCRFRPEQLERLSA